MAFGRYRKRLMQLPDIKPVKPAPVVVEVEPPELPPMLRQLQHATYRLFHDAYDPHVIRTYGIDSIIFDYTEIVPKLWKVTDPQRKSVRALWRILSNGGAVRCSDKSAHDALQWQGMNAEEKYLTRLRQALDLARTARGMVRTCIDELKLQKVLPDQANHEEQGLKDVFAKLDGAAVMLRDRVGKRGGSVVLRRHRVRIEGEEFE